MKDPKKTHIHTKGFSLVELMVALTIFSIVMTVAIGTLLVLIDANTKAQALSTATTNLSFAIDSMTRNLRTGKDFYCTNATISDTQADGLYDSSTFGTTKTQNCPGGGGSVIIYTPGFATTTRVGYRLNGQQIEQWVDRNSSTDGWVPITSNQPPTAVSITRMVFDLTGSDNTSATTPDYSQPAISLIIEGEVDNGLTNTTNFKVQSNVTQRVLNF